MRFSIRGLSFFTFKLLSFAIREPQPRHMVDYRHRFAFIILNERACHLPATAVVEEICFRFGIKIQNVPCCPFSNSLPD